MRFWRKRGLAACLLSPLAGLFCALTSLRRLLYRAGVLNSWRSPVPVIVVGNISVGGTGKTPVVVALTEFLQAQGLTPGVISRGYGGKKQASPLLLDANSDAREAGDEPVLIYQRTKAPVCVFPDRPAAARAILKHSDCNVLLADDGLQHYPLQRDCEIVVVDATKQHGNAFCLPAGPLREPVSRLNSVDFVLWNRQLPSDDGCSFYLHVRQLVNVHDAHTLAANALTDRAVTAVAGTASPERFFATLEALGYSFETRVFADHHAFCAADFENLSDSIILMTEKDAVKCRHFGLTNAWYLAVDAELPAALKQLVQQVALSEK